MALQAKRTTDAEHYIRFYKRCSFFHNISTGKSPAEANGLEMQVLSQTR